MDFATGKCDPMKYINCDNLPFGPDRPRVIEVLARALLAAYAAAPDYWADETRSDPIWPVLKEATELFAQDFRGKVNPQDGSYMHG